MEREDKGRFRVRVRVRVSGGKGMDERSAVGGGKEEVVDGEEDVEGEGRG